MKYYFSVFLLFLLSTPSIFAIDEIESKELYLEYSSYPQRVFTGQKFDVKLKALILKDENSYDKIVTTFTQEENIIQLNQDVNWTKNSTSEYTTTITYKVFHGKFVLPKITLALTKDEEIIDFISIDSPLIEYENIAINQKLFSNIIGKNLEVFTVKTKQYTNNTLHTTLHIEALNSNLEDFRLDQFATDQGIKSITNKYPTQSLYYYVLIPSHTKQINFNYYNTESKSFVMIHIPIILDEELVSTQTELNPYNSSLLIYKQVASGVVLFFCILLFIIRRTNFYLFLITVLIAFLAYLFIPNKKILLKRDIKVYILPTNNSTVFKTLEAKKIVEIVNENKIFYKVLFTNESIGWINKDDI